MEEWEKEDSNDNDKAAAVVLASYTEREAHWQFGSGLWAQEG